MRYENQGRSNVRIQRRYNPNRRGGARRVRPENNSQQPRRPFNRNNGQGERRRLNRGGRNDRGSHKKIRRDNGPKNVNKKKDADTLDREMRDYWAKTGSAKGKSEDKNVASLKMNEQMDQYWKKAKKVDQEEKKDEKK